MLKEIRQASLATGGGEHKPVKVDLLSEQVLELIGEQISPIANPYDNDAELNVANEDSIIELSQLSNPATTDKQQSDFCQLSKSTDTKNAVIEIASPPKAKIPRQTSSKVQSNLDLVLEMKQEEHELKIKCIKEQHELVTKCIEAEHKKRMELLEKQVGSSMTLDPYTNDLNGYSNNQQFFNSKFM